MNRTVVAQRRQLTTADWLLLASVAALQVATAVAIRIRPLASVRSHAGRVGRQIIIASPVDQRRVIWAIEATGRRLGRLSTCLVRALVGEAILSSPAHPVRFAIGVKRATDGSLDAHAWLESEDGVLIGGTSDRYDRLVEWHGTSA